MNTPSSASRFGRAFIAITAVVVVIVLAFGLGRRAGRSSHAHDDGEAMSQTSKKQLYTCSMHPQVIRDAPGTCPICRMDLTPVGDEGADMTGPGVRINPVLAQNMGLRVATVGLGTVSRSIRAVGYVTEPEPLHRDVNLRVSGWVEKLYADTDGMMVERGQPLFDLYSPELQVAVEELIAARTSRDASGGDGQARAMADALFAAASRKLELWGLTAGQVAGLAKGDAAPGVVPILSPMTAHVTEKNVYEGAAVKAGDLVLRLADRSAVWVDAQVFEHDLPLVRVGAAAAVGVAGQPGERAGTVSFVHPHLDPMTRTALVRVVLPNADMALRQGMYATVTVAGPTSAEAPTVPREAVIDTGTRQVAYVATGDGHYEPRDVRIGESGADGTVQVLSGLSAGDAVVVSGQFLIDSESRMREAIRKQSTAGMVEPVAMATTPPAPRSMATAGPATRPSTMPAMPIDDVLSAYLDVSAALGASQTSDRPVDVAPLIRRAGALRDNVDASVRPRVDDVLTAANLLSGKPLGAQREAFKALSNAMIVLATDAGPRAAPAYVAHCPMANADWLQRTRAVANPYYATSMKECGEIVRAIGE